MISEIALLAFEVKNGCAFVFVPCCMNLCQDLCFITNDLCVVMKINIFVMCIFNFSIWLFLLCLILKPQKVVCPERTLSVIRTSFKH